MTALHSGLWEGKCNIPVMVVVPKKQNTFIQEEGKKEEKKKKMAFKFTHDKCVWGGLLCVRLPVTLPFTAQ